MVTSWPKRLPGPGMSAERVAERIRTLSGGRIDITVYAAGEVVPAFEVLDAVGNGVADIGHTASFYWQGKMPAAAFFTTVPFGLTPAEHVAWIEAGGGQALWDELYAPFGVKPFMAGNTGVCMGGWFRREIKSLADLRGLKLRSLGLGGEVYRRLGATPQTTPPAEILTACNRACSTAPNSSAPAPTSRSGSIAWRRSTIIPASTSRTAPASASSRSKRGTRSTRRAQGDRRACLRRGGELRAGRDGAAQRGGAGGADQASTASSSTAFPDDLVAAAREQARRRAGREFAAHSDIARQDLTTPTTTFRERTAPWSRVSIEAVLRARG